MTMDGRCGRGVENRLDVFALLCVIGGPRLRWDFPRSMIGGSVRAP